MNTSESDQLFQPIPVTVSAGVHLMILHCGGAVPPPTSFIWLMTSVLASGDLMGGAEMNSPLCDRSRVFGGSEVKTDPGWGACGVMWEHLTILKSNRRATVWRLHFASLTSMWLQPPALPTSRRARQLAYQLAALLHPSSLGQAKWHISAGRNRWGAKKAAVYGGAYLHWSYSV